MKNVVFGSAGQLGRDLCPRLGRDVVPLTRADVDLTDDANVRRLLVDYRPDVVINCAAYNFVDRAEEEPDAAFAVNALAVHNLARTCHELHCILVHFSTDYVFGLDAARDVPWSEDDCPGPGSTYGASKLAGEHLVRAVHPEHFTIRTCGLYGILGSGGKGGNFVETMLKLAQRGGPIRVVDDQHCTPTYTADLADAVVSLIATEQFGLYHLTNYGSCTWYELAKAIFELKGIDVEVIPITSEEFGAKARRPRYSVLGMDKYESLGLPPMRPWRDALASYLIERKKEQST